MRVRRLTDAGLAAAAAYLQGDSLGDEARRREILEEPSLSVAIEPAIDVQAADFPTRLALGKAVSALLEGLSERDVEEDKGLWAWLALFHFETLCPRGTKPGALARWIPEGEYSRYYRHLVAGPFRICRLYKDDPEMALCILANRPHEMGEIVEQIASRLELVTNPAAVAAATRLYVDSRSRTIKRGAGGKGPGSPRRFATVLNQLDLTWDMYAMDADELLSLLPPEFEKFKNTP